MLVLTRKEGQWVTITHKSGDIIHIRVCDTRNGYVRLVFNDGELNFDITRPEAKSKDDQGSSESGK